MNEAQTQGRLSWLYQGMEARRNDIARLLRRAAGVCAFIATNFSVHKKFLELMDQVAEEKEKEYEILHEIETVEKHHEEMKLGNRLRQADPSLAAKKKAPNAVYVEEEKPKRSNFLKFLFLLFFFSSGDQGPKPKSN